jgi:hypothetical protein
MERITIQIKTVNAAFENFPQKEVKRILIDFANSLPCTDISPNSKDHKRYNSHLRDINGNVVGKVTIS